MTSVDACRNTSLGPAALEATQRAPLQPPADALPGAATSASLPTHGPEASRPSAGVPVWQRVPRYQAQRLASLDEFLQRCAALQDGHSLPFHHPHWLRAWYQTVGRQPGLQPLLLAVQQVPASGAGQAGDGPRASRDVLLLPLVQRRHRGPLGLPMTVAEYADAGVADYTGPVLHPQWAGGAEPALAARALWRALRPALAGCDLLAIEKMLPQLLDEAGGTLNPLALALPVQSGELWGNQFSVDGDWEGWRRSLDKRVRKEIERCWRVFQRSPEARFEQVLDPVRAAELLQVLERQQSDRLRPLLGAAYRLDQPAYRDFYRQLLATGLADGTVVFTVLLDQGEVVSALFGVANQARYIGLRQSLGGEAWHHCSPGRLLDEGTAAHLHAGGRRHFDFGVGSYFHKTTLRMARIPLVDTRVALGWRGLGAAWAWQAKRWLKRQPRLLAAWRRWQARGQQQVAP